MIEEIKGKPIQFGKSVKLSEFLIRKGTLGGDYSKRSVDFRDFYIEDINCNGSLFLPPYDLNDSPDCPARLLGKALKPEVARDLWRNMDKTKTSSYLSIVLLFNTEKYYWDDFCDATGRQSPLVCSLIIPDGNSHIEYFGDIDTTYFSENDRFFSNIRRWKFSEEPEEARSLRWAGAAIHEIDLSWTHGLGEALLTPNQPDLINEMQLKFVPFSGRF